MAKQSRHPISQAILASYDGELESLQVVENQGFGLEANFANNNIKLGKKTFCQIGSAKNFDQNLSTCFMKFGETELVFLFEDKLKSDAAEVVAHFKKLGKKIILLSGDNQKTVEQVARATAIDEFYFEQTPIDKVNFLQKLKAQKQKFMMIGDGLNDAPALALSDVSISFSKAADITQNIADVIIQGENLAPLKNLLSSSKQAIRLMKQNLVIALVYNLIAVPFAMAGSVVPLVAAIAMSSSSLLVLFNSLRQN